jgi:hypothetical protein
MSCFRRTDALDNFLLGGFEHGYERKKTIFEEKSRL